MGKSSWRPTCPLQELSPPVAQVRAELEKFVLESCQPAELEFEKHMEGRVGVDRWSRDAVPGCVDRLKEEAKRRGLWNLFLTRDLVALLPSFAEDRAFVRPSVSLTHREYGVLCEVMGHSFLAAEACNCSAPDTGNMEVLLRHGTPEQQRKYLLPLLDGSIRSAFLMTEPKVASSDSTNLQTTLTELPQQPGQPPRYDLHGTKWWSTGAMDPRCHVALVVARTELSAQQSHNAHTVVVIPMSSPGIRCLRALTVFGYDDAPHGHATVHLNHVPVHPDTDVILGVGQGFQIAQSRLGPGRLHHCMRSVGMASRCYKLMLQRSLSRTTFGRTLSDHGACQQAIAEASMDLDKARLLTLSCAAVMDQLADAMQTGALHDVNQRKLALAVLREKIAMAKVAVPNLTYNVVDRAMQVHGGAGVDGQLPMARILAGLRTLRIADGPDEVHRRTIAKLAIRAAKNESKFMSSKL